MKPEKQRFLQITLYCASTLVLIWGFLLVGILAVGLPKPTVSDIEKRTLAKLPDFTVESLLSGEYFRGLEAYYADTFPGRDWLVQAASAFNSMKGVSMGELRVYETSHADTGAPPADSSHPDSDTENPSIENSSQENEAEAENQEEKPLPTRPPVDETGTGEQIGSSFVYKDMALPIFWGNPDAGRRYADVLGQYAEALDGKVTVYNLIIPSSIEFYLPEKYQSVTTPQRANIQSIYDMMDSRIHTVDAYSEIAPHAKEYLYFRTDHHWTAQGAYYAYRAFAKEAGFTPTPLYKMEHRQLSGPFLGTLYSQTQDAKLAKNPDVLDYYIPPVAAVNYQYRKDSPYTPHETTVWAEYAAGAYSYSLFLHGDYPLSHLKTENHNGKSILMVKESFGNAFAPFLINDYENVYVVDQRYFQLNLIDFILSNNIQELLFINNIFAAQTDIRTYEISRLMMQQYGPVAPTIPKEETSSAETATPAPVEETQPETPPTGGEQDPGAVTTPVEPVPQEQPQAKPEEEEPTPWYRTEDEEEKPAQHARTDDDEDENIADKFAPPVRVKRESAYQVPSREEAERLEDQD